MEQYLCHIQASGAMVLEAMGVNPSPLSETVVQLVSHGGTQSAAKQLRNLLAGGEFLKGIRQGKVQDPSRTIWRDFLYCIVLSGAFISAFCL